jgi:phosphoribosyl-dephospho-CoA transferase
VSESVHTLLRISSAADLATSAPAWAVTSLARAPWVVVRRAPAERAGIAVGVRGAARAERFASTLAPGKVRERVTPCALVARRAWSARACARPALAVLDEVAAVMERFAFAGAWGPVGSVGFELASGCPTTHAASDLDLMLETRTALAPERAAALARALGSFAARIDLLLETPYGALALDEYVRARPPYLVRTAGGARRVTDPWLRPAA